MSFYQAEQAKILDMVARGKITAEEADLLLGALAGEDGSATPEIETSEKGKNHHVLNLSGEHKLQIGIEGVSPEFIQALAELDLSQLEGEQIVQMGIEGVSPDFIRAIAGLDLRYLQGEHIVQMAVEGVSPDMIRALAECDLQDFDGEHIVQMAVEGVSLDIIRELATL